MYCMSCGKETYSFHEGIGMIVEKDTNKKIPLMVCDECYNKSEILTNAEDIHKSKMEFVQWKLDEAVTYAKKRIF